MLCWFLESETYSMLTSQIIHNIHSTTEELSEDIFTFIDHLVILIQLAVWNPHNMRQTQMSLEIPDFNIIME